MKLRYFEVGLQEQATMVEIRMYELGFGFFKHHTGTGNKSQVFFCFFLFL